MEEKFRNKMKWDPTAVYGTRVVTGGLLGLLESKEAANPIRAPQKCRVGHTGALGPCPPSPASLGTATPPLQRPSELELLHRVHSAAHGAPDFPQSCAVGRRRLQQKIKDEAAGTCTFVWAALG